MCFCGKAYEESIKPQLITLEEKKPAKTSSEYNPVEAEYRDALFQRLTKLLKEPKTPIVANPKIVRVMILPYQGDSGKELYSARYIYLMVEEPKWMLQNFIDFPPEENK